MGLNICEGEYCPLCEARVIPGLDAVYCRNCQEYYPTPSGIKMEEERRKKKEERQRLTALERKKRKEGIDNLQLLLTSKDDGGYSHHEFEDSY